ncbi:hypothetical protein CVT26_011472 [Gymnopilus dilepis]|uniref:BRCT domain-containing protein n=1 Tax=Gymnopilus dilepis TaxID=231916 RepID=A0A409W8N8_9AGAR|nr:hypothetical protein CVT26_011472 [Gymnopilus dilepis]
MPEIQILKSNESMINSGKGMVRAGDLATRITPENVKTQMYRLEMVSVTLAKRHVTTTVLPGYTIPPRSEGWTYAPPEWIAKADEEGYGHLMAISPPGPLTCRSRGKILVIAAGKHAVTVCLALETAIIGMPTSTYRKIIEEGLVHASDIDKKGPKLPTFLIPSEMVVPLSSKQNHVIRIVAAFVSEKWTWTINDFTSLVRLHVTSRDRPWSSEEIQPDNKEVWELLLERYNSGPDLVLEWGIASEKMDEWRDWIIRTYRRRIASISNTKTCGSTRKSSSFSSKEDYILFLEVRNPNYNVNSMIEFNLYRTSGSTDSATNHNEESNNSFYMKLNPIRHELTKNRFLCFSGIGKYTANEILHELAIFPGTPSYFICCNGKRYADFKEGIRRYVKQFSTDEYLSRASSVPNTNNPVSFNEHLNTLYLRKYVKVYRRRMAVVPRDLYNKYLSLGLLDPNHTIGRPYQFDKSKLLPENKKWKYLPVLRYHKPLAAYTIIAAKPPEEWGTFPAPSYVSTDINEFGYATTIGPAQFRVQLLNRPDFRNIEPGFFKPGRPKTERTGRRGRPRKGLTRKRVKKMLASQGGRSFKHLILGNPNSPAKKGEYNKSELSDLTAANIFRQRWIFSCS